MSAHPLVSVIIPSYNRAAQLKTAIDSVLQQRFQDWELIVVDDGSSDETPRLARRFPDRRVRMHRQARRGVSAARNAGLSLARAPWIAFLDSDDSWKPQKLHRQLEQLEMHPAYRLAYTDEIWIRNGRRVNPKKIHRKNSGWIYERCLRRCIVSPSSILLHRSVLPGDRWFDESFPVCEDYELWLRLSARLPFLFVPQPLIVKTGGHPDQLSKSRWGLDRFRVRALLKTFRNSPLTPRQRMLTAGEIVAKSNILASGCQKRGRRESAAFYRALVRFWRLQQQFFSQHF